MVRKAVVVLLVLSTTTISLFLSSCIDDYSAQDLQDAKGRYFSGNASQSDKRMVEGFYKWKSQQ